MRLLPFLDTLSSGLEKVRAALSASAQRELAKLMEGLSFVGVPAHAAPKEVRAAIEQSWFEQRPLALRYCDRDNVITHRRVQLRAIVFERSSTLLDCVDTDKGQSRHLMLDRIEAATVV